MHDVNASFFVSWNPSKKNEFWSLRLASSNHWHSSRNTVPTGYYAEANGKSLGENYPPF